MLVGMHKVKTTAPGTFVQPDFTPPKESKFDAGGHPIVAVRDLIT
jgi:hypothetical protein